MRLVQGAPAATRARRTCGSSRGAADGGPATTRAARPGGGSRSSPSRALAHLCSISHFGFSCVDFAHRRSGSAWAGASWRRGIPTRGAVLVFSLCHEPLSSSHESGSRREGGALGKADAGASRRARAEAGGRARAISSAAAAHWIRAEAAQHYSSLPNGVCLVSWCMGASVDSVPSRRNRFSVLYSLSLLISLPRQ